MSRGWTELRKTGAAHAYGHPSSVRHPIRLPDTHLTHLRSIYPVLASLASGLAHISSVKLNLVSRGWTELRTTGAAHAYGHISSAGHPIRLPDTHLTHLRSIYPVLASVAWHIYPVSS